MSVKLIKGQKTSLNKGSPNLKNIDVTIGWRLDALRSGNAMLDLDVSAFLLTAMGKVEGPENFIFYGNLRHPSGAVILFGNSTRNLNDFTVRLKIDLNLMPPAVMRVPITATIYEAEARSQNFAQVRNAFITIGSQQTGEIVRYDLAEKFNNETAVVFGEIYRNNNEWKFNAMGNGCTGGLAALCGNYGVEVG